MITETSIHRIDSLLEQSGLGPDDYDIDVIEEALSDMPEGIEKEFERKLMILAHSESFDIETEKFLLESM